MLGITQKLAASRLEAKFQWLPKNVANTAYAGEVQVVLTIFGARNMTGQYLIKKQDQLLAG